MQKKSGPETTEMRRVVGTKKREFAFAEGAQVTQRHTAIVGGAFVQVESPHGAGKVIAREMPPAYPKPPEDESVLLDDELPDGPLPQYRVEYADENGRPDTAWWEEDMLIAA